MKEFDFYIVPTPIGNLGDITNRAVEVLKFVDIIACEDSRVTQKLINHFDIKTKCISYHKYNEKERLDYFLEILKSGKKMALVSDAGTPLICDPGAVLVEELRKNDVKVTSLPGANAVVTFLSQIPRDSEVFTFVGFLPKTASSIEDIIKTHKKTDLVFYESPNRLLKTLRYIKDVLPDSKIAIGRELTKMFEEIVIDTVDNVIKHFEKNVIKGEIVGMIYHSEDEFLPDEIDEKINILKSKNFKAKEISIIVSELYGANKNDIYKKIISKENNS